MERTILARIHLANNEVEAAIQLLTRLLQVAEDVQHIGKIIELLALHALALSAQGYEEQALRTLARALVLAEPSGYIRTFVREGALMEMLLVQVLEAVQAGKALLPYNVFSNYVHTLLAALGHHVPSSITPLQQAATIRRLPPTPALSEREREIVRLMAQGYSDREIAQQLMLAESTVKTYAKRVYAKLDVKNRMQAVTSARNLHLL